jgi:ATP-binding cassette subfamily F protein 3
MIIACNHIKKAFLEQVILEDIHFHIEQGEKVALVGNNGAGKTTLFKIIAKEMSADTGEIFYAKNCRIGYLKQHMELSSSYTVYDELIHVFDEVVALEKTLHDLEQEIAKTNSLEKINAYDALRTTFEDKKGYSYKSLVKGILKGLGFSNEVYTQPIQTLSGGQKTRVALAKLLLEEPDVLLLDEPTNHLDIQAIQWLENFLRSYKGAVILISHDRYFLDKTVQKVVHLEFGKSHVYHGNYSYFVVESEKVYESALNEYNKQQQELKRQQAVIAKLRQFNREKSIKRARSREKLLEKQTFMDAPMVDKDSMQLDLTPAIESGNDVLTVTNLAHSFDEQQLFSGLDFQIKKGDKVAVVGPNGVGKTTLFKIILNALKPKHGIVHLGSNVHIGYYDQEHMNLNENLNIFDEIQNDFPTLTGTRIRNVLAAFLFTGEDVFKPIHKLSGGERGRVALAKIMLSNANFLILDEPTNHLDILSKEVLESAIANYAGTVLYISHDRYFINQTATKVFHMQADGITTYLGDYDYYIEKSSLLQLQTTASEGVPTSNSATSTKEDWQKQKEIQARHKKLLNTSKQAEEDIATKEAEIAALDSSLCDPDVYSNFDRAKEITDAKEKLQKEIEGLYEIWENLSLELEDF